MHLDHLVYAAGPEGLPETARRLGAELGATFADGGFHPRFGTRNNILPLSRGHYLEVVEVLDHPAADKVPFGQAVRARSLEGGGWLGWVVAADDLPAVEARIGRTAVPGHRHRPDGTLLEWQQLGVKNMQSDPQLPFFVHWLSDPAVHPSSGGEIALLEIELAGDPAALDDWLGESGPELLGDVVIAWTEPDGQSGLRSAVFEGPRGQVRL